MQQNELSSAIGKLQVKGIVIEGSVIGNLQYKNKVLSFFSKAHEKNIPVIIYCETDTSENMVFEWKKTNASWIKTATQSDLKKVLAEEKIHQNNCLYLSTGESNLYRITRSNIHYVLIQPSTDFDTFFELGYQLPVNLAEVYPETENFIKNLNYKQAEMKTRRVENLIELSLNAEGCLTIKMNNGSPDYTYKDINELNKMLKWRGFDSSQGAYNLYVKLLMGEEFFLKEDKLSQLGYIPMPALLQYRCSEEGDNKKLMFYLYDRSNEGHPVLAQLADNHFWVNLSFEEDCVYQITDKIKNKGYQAIREAKNIDFVNLKKLYQELCKKNKLDFKDVWSRVTCPLLYKVSGFLRIGLEKEGAVLLTISLDADGLLQIKASKKIEKNISASESFFSGFGFLDNKPLIFGHKFLDDIFELTAEGGEIQAKLENVERLKSLLSYFGLHLEDKALKELYRGLCEINKCDFDRVWANVQPNLISMLHTRFFSEAPVVNNNTMTSNHSVSSREQLSVPKQPQQLEQKMEEKQTFALFPLAVKGIIIEENLMTDVDFLLQVQALIQEAEQKRIPVIIYCATDSSETDMFLSLKNKNLSWPVTVAQNGLKDCLAQKRLNSDECLYLSTGKSLLYAKTKKTNNYVVVKSTEDFTLFLKPDYEIPKPHVAYAKRHPEICQLIDRLNFKLVENIIVPEAKNKNLQAFMNKYPLKISLNAEGCLLIKINKKILGMMNKNSSLKKVFNEFFNLIENDDKVAKFHNIEEFRKMLKHCGYGFHQGCDITVRRLTGINNSLTLERISTWGNKLTMHTLIKYCYGDQDKYNDYFDNSDDEDFLFYYYDSTEDGTPQLTELANKNNQLGELKLEFGDELDVSDQIYKMILDEIRSAKKMYYVNFEALYKELCQKNGLDFNLVWRKAQHCPMIENICRSLSSNISTLGSGLKKTDDIREDLVSLKLENDGVLYIVVDKSLSSKIQNSVYLEHRGYEKNPDGKLCIKCKTADELYTILVCLKISTTMNDVEKLYKELCQQCGFDFDRIWDEVDRADDDCVIQ